MSRTDLTEQQWRALEPHLPADLHRGHGFVDHLTVINGILWRQKTGATWRDVPARYGPWQTCHDRYVRWSRNGTWQRILKKGAVRDEWLGHSRGGWTSEKIHLCVDGHGRPLSLLVTADQCSDVTQLEPVLDAIAVPRLGPGRPRRRPSRLRVDRAYGTRKGCNAVERGINRLKDFRAVATRYDKRGHHYLTGVVAAIVIWLPNGYSDGSEHAFQAVLYLIDFVKAHGPIEVHVVNIEPKPLAWQTRGMEPEAIESHLAVQAHVAMDSALHALNEAGISHQSHVRLGDAAEEIVALADELGADTIMMGTRGLGTLSGLALGSVTRKVLHLARVPVVCVKLTK